MGLENTLFVHLASPVIDDDTTRPSFMTKTEARPERDQPDNSIVEDATSFVATPLESLAQMTKTKARPEGDDSLAWDEDHVAKGQPRP